MQAVLNVIMNRAKGNFSNAASVVLKPKQFSVWNSISDPYDYSVKIAQKPREGNLQDTKQYREAVRLVDLAMKGQLKDITGGATFYFNPKLANPSWAKKLKFLKRIGNHDFYGTK
jgi:spore germination cell wall hydrolase CwlJ-like protein